MPFQVKAAIFDVYHTLVTPMARGSIKEALRARGITSGTPGYAELCDGSAEGRLLADLGLDRDAANRTLLTRPLPTIDELAAALPGPRGRVSSPDVLAEARELFDMMIDGCVLSPGAAEALESLSALGVRIGLLSNINSISARVITRLGLDRWSSATVLSCDVGCCKPDLPIFRAAVARLGAPASDVVMVGDSWTSDVVGALRAGLRAIWLDRNDDPVAQMIVAGRAGELAPRDAEGTPRFAAEGRAMVARWFPVALDQVERELAGAADGVPASVAGVRRIGSLAEIAAAPEAML
ncbi:HAD family hydrolase [Sorangium sp. So ce1151]|uniref:HAD family hydrolase n=1 Tax=Sorangium sp. So ce1151 TaxID=3133332 RepID=UPI003F629FCA